MEDLKCPECKSQLNWLDTTDSEGGIREGYLIETSVWECPKCNQDYVIQEKAEFVNNKIIYFRKN